MTVVAVVARCWGGDEMCCPQGKWAVTVWRCPVLTAFSIYVVRIRGCIMIRILRLH